jgi:hypothetical protein
VKEEQLIEVNFLMGEWMPILELSAKLREEQSPAEDESDSESDG